MARQTIWMEKTKFHNTLILIEKSIKDMENQLKELRKVVGIFKNTIIYEEKSQ
tara:strand:+ start:284 stop:442 length:159 start_codon:yes stop_codon:yes gene_type:complete